MIPHDSRTDAKALPRFLYTAKTAQEPTSTSFFPSRLRNRPPKAKCRAHFPSLVRTSQNAKKPAPPNAASDSNFAFGEVKYKSNARVYFLPPKIRKRRHLRMNYHIGNGVCGPPAWLRASQNSRRLARTSGRAQFDVPPDYRYCRFVRPFTLFCF